ncbi:hypothetical protein SN811_01370 [Ligilactobacillus agilis]|uniref:Uncharacterized protein n=1 Tax=Ligilactobacillus agilis TaxID=1601 RepID=A0A6F9Y2G1_9LACO|nr:hypothetical protein [Ligilactobacillus agilis]GET11637.1 hypothetical protein SN811_01370 [Ligilactobacillus agilis]
MYDLGDLYQGLDELALNANEIREAFKTHKVNITESERVRLFLEFKKLEARLDIFRSVVDDLQRGISV